MREGTLRVDKTDCGEPVLGLRRGEFEAAVFDFRNSTQKRSIENSLVQTSNFDLHGLPTLHELLGGLLDRETACERSTRHL